MIPAFFWLVALVLVVLGLVGLVAPAVPGGLLLFLGLLVAAWAEGFEHVGYITLLFLAMLAVLTFVVDIIAAAYGANRFGASPRSVAGATIGAIVGLLFGIPGLLLGPFVGAVIGELTNSRQYAAVAKAGIGATLGLALGVAAKLSIGISMIGIFIFIRLVG